VYDVLRAARRGSLRRGEVVRRLGGVFALGAILLLVACAGPTRTGPSFASLAKSTAGPKAGQGRIVVLRDKDFADIFDIGWQVRLDGEPMGDLKNGTFVYRDRGPGSHQLTFERAGDLYRASHRTVSVAGGHTYYFRLELNDKGRTVMASGVAAGLAGMLIASAATSAQDDRGLFDFTPLEGAAAQQALAELRLATAE
jgi:hypothetical protein